MIILVILFTLGVTYVTVKQPAPVEKTSEQIYREVKDMK